MRPANLNQCDISAGEFAACLDLSFHLCINLPSQHSVTESILFSLLQLNFISLLLFSLKTLSEWERLNSDNSQLSTHLSILSFINLLPVSSFLYVKKQLTCSYCYTNFQYFLSVFLRPLPSVSHIYSPRQCSYLSGHPSILKQLSHLNSPSHLALLSKMLLSIFLFFFTTLFQILSL